MKSFLLFFASILFIPLMIGNLHCTMGDEPEVVVVPVGEPGDSDPYASNGDMGCGGSTSAELVSSDTVLLSFSGVHDIWLITMPKTEFLAVVNRLSEEEDLPDYSEIQPEQVDALHTKFCYQRDKLSADELRVYQIVSDTLGSDLEDIEHKVCD